RAVVAVAGEHRHRRHRERLAGLPLALRAAPPHPGRGRRTASIHGSTLVHVPTVSGYHWHLNTLRISVEDALGGTVLEVDGLTRRFGTVVANEGIGLRVRAGEVVGLLGHNGAGKTTLVSQLVGLLKPDAGSIRVAGADAVADPAAARRRVALQAQAQAPI